MKNYLKSLQLSQSREIILNEAPPVGAQSGSRIYQSPQNAKISNSHFRGGGGSVGGQLLVLSPNLLKSKKKFTRGFAGNFLRFCGKKVPGNGFGL